MCTLLEFYIMTEISTIFQNTAFPVAVCVVLFYVCYYFVKSELKQNENAMQIVKDANDKHLNYLQAQNERLTQIIAECTKALNDNTKAFNELISVLDFFKQRKVPE